MEHPKYGYEQMLPEAILKLESLEHIAQLTPSQRGWLTQVYRGNPDSFPAIKEV